MAFANPGSIVKSLGIENGQTVVDIGAGSGAYLEALAERVGGNGIIYAIEIQKELVTKIGATVQQFNLKMVKPLWADAEVLGGTTLPDEVADWVLVANVLSLSTHSYILVKEVARILKPSGRVVVIDWQKSVSAVKEVLTQGGFRLVGEVTAGSHHFGLILTKTI
ncbi:MAG: methyltransferase domain-containing protein [Candidatus Vogelbacteria bacterium]|nr:methyltransferase domain-containing protein [Candidatus Vogelbacteria bacterium]